MDDILATLEALVDAGLIRAYGWSTDDPDKAVAFAKGPHCAAVQHVLNVFEDTPALLAVCDDHDLASINRAPLAMGLLGGRYGPDSRLPSNDVRGDDAPAWVAYFRDGRPSPEFLRRLDAIRTSSPAAAAASPRARSAGCSPATAHRPDPRIRTPAQAEDNAGILTHGPLTPAQLAEINRLLDR